MGVEMEKRPMRVISRHLAAAALLLAWAEVAFAQTADEVVE
jgi:hypothetical protein